MRPVARPAAKGRHRGLLASFLLAVVAPVVLTAVYMLLIAQDRYASTVGFTVRTGTQESSASALLGGIASLTGASASADANILNQFIRSQQMVEAVDRKLDLRRVYGSDWWKDPVFALRPDASIEDMTDYWGRVVSISYDQATGLMEVEVNAFSPDDSRAIAQEILAQSQSLVNSINDSAHRDAIRYAQDELQMAEDRLKNARANLTEFRTRSKIVDLQADLQGKMGVLTDLQRQLVQEQVGLRDLLASTRSNDPRVAQAQRRIDVLNERISSQRDDLAKTGGAAALSANGAATGTAATGTAATGALGGGDQTPDFGYPEAISKFEALQTDQEFAEKTYVTALAALDSARMDAMRRNRYLAVYIEPTLAQKAEYPQRIETIGLAILFLTLIWGVGALIFYSVRDRA